MLFHNKRLYKSVRRAKLGPPRNGPLEELRLWIGAQYDVSALYVALQAIELGPSKGHPRLYVAVETPTDRERFLRDPFRIRPNIRARILRKCANLLAEHQVEAPRNLLQALLVVDDFSEEAKRLAVEEFCERDAQQVIAEYDDANIWDIIVGVSDLLVFYETDADVAGNAFSGLSTLLEDRCFEFVTQYDEFDYFERKTFEVHFDSKERLDREYQGSLFYYLR